MFQPKTLVVPHASVHHVRCRVRSLQTMTNTASRPAALPAILDPSLLHGGAQDLDRNEEKQFLVCGGEKKFSEICWIPDRAKFYTRTEEDE